MPQLQYACSHRPRCQKAYTKQGNLVRHILRDHRTDCSVGLDGEEMDLDNTTHPACDGVNFRPLDPKHLARLQPRLRPRRPPRTPLTQTVAITVLRP
jgi:hypothetical protein